MCICFLALLLVISDEFFTFWQLATEKGGEGKPQPGPHFGLKVAPCPPMPRALIWHWLND